MQIDQLVIKYIGDESVTYAALETGEVTFASVPPQFLEDAQANADIEVFEAVQTTLYYFGMNNQFPPFDNLKVRQAIAYAIDRDMIVDIAFEGRAIATYQPLAVGNQVLMLNWKPMVWKPAIISRWPISFWMKKVI